MNGFLIKLFCGGKLTNEDIYFGSKLALIEMIKSGTTLNEMYFLKGLSGSIKAIEEMGLRAVVISQ